MGRILFSRIPSSLSIYLLANFIHVLVYIHSFIIITYCVCNRLLGCDRPTPKLFLAVQLPYELPETEYLILIYTK